MALPRLNEDDSFSQIELLSGKKIGIKPWRVGEERELLFAVEGNPDSEAGRKEILKMIRKCVDNPSIFDTLSNVDYVYLLAQIRMKSKGSKIEYNYKCPVCGFPLSDDVSLITDLKTKPFSGKVFKANENLSFGIKEVPFTVYDVLREAYEKTSEYTYHYILNSISSIGFKGEEYTDFTEEELKEFLDQMNTVEFDALGTYVTEAVAEISLEKKLVCGRCTAKNKEKTVIDVQFGDLYYFLAF